MLFSAKIHKHRQLKKLLLIDNYDSFTWNLTQIIEECGETELCIMKNDEMNVDFAKQFDAVMISPGPGIPSESGICCDIIRKYSATKPILGICLGHQAIAEVFGAKLYNLQEVQHGTCVSLINLNDELIFNGLDGEIVVGLYHSWAVSEIELPSCLEITAHSQDGVIMAIRHKKYNVRGLQFHPESVMTPSGPAMIKNWVHNINKFN